MITKGVHHVSLNITDVDRARDFYANVLGLRELDRPDFGFPGLWFDAGSVQLHLIVAPPGIPTGSPAESPNPITGHLAFEIDDYAAARSALEERGLDVMELGPDVGQMFATDPDRNVIELIVPGGQLGRT